jgi:hypothetical protein
MSFRPPEDRGVEDFEGPVPNRITGAEKLMFGMFAGPWKLAGRPLGRVICALFACWTPGGGAVPGADMPGGGPVKISLVD